MFSEPLDNVKEYVNKLSQKKTVTLGNFFIKARRVTAIWNHSIAIGLLYASFEIYELCMLLTFVTFVNVICLIVNQ